MLLRALEKRIVGRLQRVLNGAEQESWLADEEVVDAFVANPDNTFIVSFPRTGSHWLRLLMELYFGRPSLKRIFYYPERTDYMSCHSHDMELDLQRSDVIYLYREPVSTIFSLLKYYEEPVDDEERIRHWADLYGRHLDKWLYQEHFTKHKTVLTYCGFRDGLPAEFAKVTAHFGLSLNVAKLEAAAARVNKAEVKRKTAHDPHVIQLEAGYARERAQFKERHADAVWSALRQGRPYLLAEPSWGR